LEQLDESKQLEIPKSSNFTKKLTLCAQTGEGNLLEIAVEAARNRTTLGEISDALERF
jgi:methylmalonyl-CoA mutase